MILKKCMLHKALKDGSDFHSRGGRGQGTAVGNACVGQSGPVQITCLSAELGGRNTVRQTVFQTDLRDEKISRRQNHSVSSKNRPSSFF